MNLNYSYSVDEVKKGDWYSTGRSNNILISNLPKTKEEREDERQRLVGGMLEIPPPDTPWLNDKMIVLLLNRKRNQ